METTLEIPTLAVAEPEATPEYNLTAKTALADLQRAADIIQKQVDFFTERHCPDYVANFHGDAALLVMILTDWDGGGAPNDEGDSNLIGTIKYHLGL